MNAAEPSTMPGSVASARRALPAYLRMALKLAAFGWVTFFVLFPNPAQFARHVRHHWNLESMVEPDAPELAAWDEELAALLDRVKAAAAQSGHDAAHPPQPAAVVQRAVESFVYEKVLYEWDWNLWASADYLPTVGEIFAKARETGGPLREDCDGRAVIAASLMRRLGYESRLATDLRHMWVVTPEGEWMGPGRAKTVVSTSQGNRVNLRSALGNLPPSLSYGIAVFPLWRELVIAAAAWLLMLHRHMPLWAKALGAAWIVQGLLFMRLGILSPDRSTGESAVWPAWLGLMHIVAGLAVLMWQSSRARRRSRATIRT